MPTQQRNEVFDGFKFLLIALVAVGHFSESYRYSYTVVLGGYSVVYLFHMPLFILLSGYFSKHISLAKIGRTFVHTWQAYLLMALAAILLITHDWGNLYEPKSSYWYLLSLMEWKIMYFLLKKTVGKDGLILGLSFALVPVGMLLINRDVEVLSVMRTICFFPFFVIGTMLSDAGLQKIRSHRLVLSVLTLLVFIAVYCLSSRYVHELLWHRRSAFQLSQEFGYTIGHVFWNTALIYIASLLVTISLLSVSKLPHWMSRYGKYSLTFYVLQEISWDINKNFLGLPMPVQYAWCFLTLLLGIFLVEKNWQDWLVRPLTIGYSRFSHFCAVCLKSKR